MSVRFILGASGTGKTTYIFKELIGKSMEDGHNPLFLILPEQANLNAEQTLVRLHPENGTMDISIVSFTRLAFKVFDELNVHTFDILDDYGKSMMLMKLIKRHQKELAYYGGMIGKQGFIDEVKSLFSEFYQYQVTPKVLEETIGRLTPERSLYHKLSDLLIILKAFEEEMQNSYMVAEQLLTLLAEVVEESEQLRGADVYFDGFTGFTPVQYQVISALMKLGCNLHFSFTMDAELFGDNDYSEHGLFYMGKQSVDKLCKLAEQYQVKVLPHVALTDSYRTKDNIELAHMERQLFRYPILPYCEKPEHISLVAARDIGDEISFVAKLIRYYVREEGYRYRDFAVITGDLPEQAGYWNRILSEEKIPYFIDASEQLAKNPIAILSGMAMDLFRKDFDYESVFAFLKSGYFGLDMQGVFALENYVLKYGVKGYSRWKMAFRGGVKGLHGINETRAAFMELIEPLTSVFEKNTAKGEAYVKALYSFMSANRIPEKIHEYSLHFERTGDLRKAKTYAGVYDSFLAVLDKTLGILGEEELSRDQFADILMTGIGDVRLGLIPATLDQVIVGDMERTRLSDVKVLFFVGTNEGILPGDTGKNGLLADKDRQSLRECDLVLAEDSKEALFRQQFYLYLQVTKAADRIFICYRETDEKGVPLRPSYFVGRVKGLFPALHVNAAGQVLGEKKLDSLPADEKGLTALTARMLMNKEIGDSAVLHMLRERNPDAFSRLMEGYYYSNQVGVLDRELVKRLYGRDMVHSVSRLETYAGCAYHFFLQYGLHLTKRELYDVKNTNVGTILHGVMERFFKEVKEGTIALKDMKEGELEEKIQSLTEACAKEENETIFESSSRMQHQLNVLIRIAKRSIKNLLFHLEQGDMKPEYFEKYFSPEDELSYIHMALEEDMTMELKGVVDRVDIKETEDVVYVKVIDYKSGAKDLDYVKMYEGKQLQLVVYMSVMIELLRKQYPGKKIIPTGMYYYHIHDPIIEESDEEVIEQKRTEANRLTGFVNQDDACLNLMDQKTGLVVPIKYKNGEPSAGKSCLVTTEELEKISDFVKEKMTEIGREIIHGQIAINPEKGDINSPCNVCDYKNVCRFEPGIGGDRYRIGSGLEKAEAKKLVLKTEDALNENTEDGGDNA